MPILAGRQRKQRTNASSIRSSLVFNAPGIYQPPFGRSKIYVSGHGTPGNAPTPGTSYTNPATPGTYAGTNPSTPGNVVYNAPVPGSSGVNAPSGGNYAGSNPTQMVPQNVYLTINYSRGDRTSYDSYRYLGPTDFAPYTEYAQHTTNYINPAGGYTYTVVNFSQSPAPGEVFYNPVIPGAPYTNNPTPGTIQYNPTTPGNPYSNPPRYVAGTTVPGSYVPGNYTPGNTNPTSVIPGTYTPPRYVAGTTIPGNTNQPVTTPGNPVAGYTNPARYVPGNLVPGNYETMIAAGSRNCPPGWINEGYHDGYNYDTQGPMCSITVAPYTNPGTTVPGNYIAPYTNPGTYVAGYTNPTQMNSSAYYPGGTSPPTYAPGNTNPGSNNSYTNSPTTNAPSYVPGNNGRNPSTPGNVIYNTPTPGTAYYNNPAPGNTVTSPPSQGSSGVAFTSLGVVFPGGPLGAPAPTIGDTLVDVGYTEEGVAVNVGPRGQVIIKEVL